MKLDADFGNRQPVLNILHNTTNDGLRQNFDRLLRRPLDVIDGIAAAVGQHFQLHGRLPFEIHPFTDAGNGRHRIKQATQAGGLRTVDAFFNHFGDDFDFLPIYLLNQRKIQVPEIVAKGRMQVTDGHAPGLFYCGAAARHGDRGQVGDPFKLFGPGHQHLAAPDCAVGPEAGAVKSQANDRAFQLVLGHAADNVSMMMLDLDNAGFNLLPGETGAQIVRMHITGNYFRLDLKNAL